MARRFCSGTEMPCCKPVSRFCSSKPSTRILLSAPVQSRTSTTTTTHSAATGLERAGRALVPWPRRIFHRGLNRQMGCHRWYSPAWCAAHTIQMSSRIRVCHLWRAHLASWRSQNYPLGSVGIVIAHPPGSRNFGAGGQGLLSIVNVQRQ